MVALLLLLLHRQGDHKGRPYLFLEVDNDEHGIAHESHRELVEE